MPTKVLVLWAKRISKITAKLTWACPVACFRKYKVWRISNLAGSRNKICWNLRSLGWLRIIRKLLLKTWKCGKVNIQPFLVVQTFACPPTTHKSINYRSVTWAVKHLKKTWISSKCNIFIKLSRISSLAWRDVPLLHVALVIYNLQELWQVPKRPC